MTQQLLCAQGPKCLHSRRGFANMGLTMAFVFQVKPLMLSRVTYGRGQDRTGDPVTLLQSQAARGHERRETPTPPVPRAPLPPSCPLLLNSPPLRLFGTSSSSSFLPPPPHHPYGPPVTQGSSLCLHLFSSLLPLLASSHLPPLEPFPPPFPSPGPSHPSAPDTTPPSSATDQMHPAHPQLNEDIYLF